MRATVVHCKETAAYIINGRQRAETSCGGPRTGAAVSSLVQQDVLDRTSSDYGQNDNCLVLKSRRSAEGLCATRLMLQRHRHQQQPQQQQKPWYVVSRPRSASLPTRFLTARLLPERRRPTTIPDRAHAPHCSLPVPTAAPVTVVG